MEGLDKRAPFTATGGIIPPEFRNIKTPCYILDEKALIKNAKLLGEVAERTGCKMLLAQKAFSNYDCYQFFEPYLAGTEASGLFEARLGAEEMPEKEVHIFNRFEKLNENAQGSGLGLSICQLIVERFGGRIWIDPEYKDGSRFLFTHPIHSTNRKEAAQ